jgi:hypothetical protein
MTSRLVALHGASRLVGVLASVGSMGCEPRVFPASFPKTSPASLELREPKPASVTAALDADPPLPGESVHDWPGLEPERPSDAAIGHSHHHHGGPTKEARPEPSKRPSPEANPGHRVDHAEHGVKPNEHAGHGHDVTEAPKP